MNLPVKGGISGAIQRYASRLRFPWLFGATAALFIADLIVPDMIPFADELLLGLVAALLGSWRSRKSDERGGEGIAETGEGPPLV